jgi:pyridoxal phosphate-dependent aminotransferase EpsN
MSKKFENRVLLSAPHMSGEEIKYIESAINRNWVMPLGPNVTEFENQVVKYLQEKNLYAVAMSSGTAAIHIALKLLKLHPNEEVFCSSATFAATANPIVYEKAIPVFIDSEDKTWNLCPKSLLKAIEHKKAEGKIPRVLISVDLFGMSAEYSEIEEICKHYNIDLIEDSAESLGSTYKNKKCGVFGKFGILSFNGNKIITTSGGGMLITHSKEEADKALFLITQARDKAPYYLHSEIGYNYRLSNISAGIGLGQMAVLDQRVEARRKIFKIYQQELKDSPLSFQKENDDFYSNHWLSSALLNDDCKKTPTELIKYLDEHNVEARHIWKPMHTQPVFKNNEFFSVNAKPISEVIFDQGLCLPSCSYMDEQTTREVARLVKSFLN